MKWTLPVLLLLVACGGRETVTETTVTTTTTTPAAGTAAGGAGGATGGAAGATTDGTGSLAPAVLGGTALVAADAVAYACLTDEQRALAGTPLAQASATLPSNTRILRPDTLATQDYLPNRVNADVDGKDVVTRVWCG